MLQQAMESLGVADPLTYLAVFLTASLLMVWRLEAMLDHGLQGTALGTLVMPYCSGLGNLVFVGIVTRSGGPAGEVLTNALVNNVTNVTLLLGVPALVWGLSLAASGGAGARGRAAGEAVAARLGRLSLFLSLAAAIFFAGAVWILTGDGRLSRADGALLVGLFLFWQTFQVVDVLKHNVRRNAGFGVVFYLDLVLVLAGAWLVYESLDWLVAWLLEQQGSFLRADRLGWLTGWLMVVPNALLALYWAARRRADICYTSQIGDGHICIPLCLGMLGLLSPVAVPAFFREGLLLFAGTVALHAVLLLVAGGLPRWAGGLLIAAYGWFLWRGWAG